MQQISQTPAVFADEQIQPRETNLLLDEWQAFNHRLDEDAANLSGEAQVARRLETLQTVQRGDHPVYWLTVARITELALKLAGDFADACEFQRAGDLLINPRHIDVYRRGTTQPIRKRRHCALSEQFAAEIGDRNPVAWLRQHTLVRVRLPALLPQLTDILVAGGHMSGDYLSSIEQRLQRVSETIAFLGAWRIRESGDLVRRLNCAVPGDREVLAAKLCRFNLRRFRAIGNELRRQWGCRQHGPSRYLRC